MSSRPASPGAPTLLVAGITHHTAPLEMRERLALPKDEAATVLTHLRETPSLREAAFLSTCNRMELYAVPDPAAEVQPNLPELLAGLLKAPPSMIAELGFVARDADAVQHLFEVASGLDSQMIGETEILGQVKDAYQRAREARVVGSLLNRVFQKSFQAAKWARSSTGIGQGQVSIGSVVVELASRIFGDLRASRVLIIGTGEVAERTLQALQSRGLHYLTVASRTLERAARLAEPLKGAALALDQVAEYLPRFDIIIASTESAEPILTAPQIKAALRERRNPLFLIDLAMPRNIDSAAADLDEIFLYNLNDLAAIVNENQAARLAEVETVRTHLEARAAHTWKSCQTRFH